MAAFHALLTSSGSLLHLFLTWLLLSLVRSCSKSRENFKYFIWQLLQISSLGAMIGSDIWYTRLLELGSIWAHTLTHHQPPPQAACPPKASVPIATPAAALAGQPLTLGRGRCGGAPCCTPAGCEGGRWRPRGRVCRELRLGWRPG